MDMLFISVEYQLLIVLSTTEAEYMALSKVVKELKFIVQLLQTMNISVELPITVHDDNVGAIWL